MTRALAFLGRSRALDYGSRLSRLRWRRAAAADRVEEWEPDGNAATLLAGARSWIVVRDARALPVGERIPEPPAGRVLMPEVVEPPIHTLRELEAARLPSAGASTAALAIRTSDFPPGGNETVEVFIERLLSEPSTRHASFQVVAFADPSEGERPELTRRLPAGKLRILDVGCGAGGGIAAARARNPAWSVTGIEKDRRLCSLARARCDRVLEGDLAEILPALEREGERFDALVFADVLEHLEDPTEALARGCRLAAPGGMVLVSVPNVGHLSLARDLLLGRFDPIPAGLTDAGHLRWFTRATLEDMLSETGWKVEAIEAQAGAPAPDTQGFLDMAAAWPDCDRASLGTYQWVAAGRAR